MGLAMEGARRMLDSVEPVAGRAALPNAQRIAYAQALATLALAEEQRIANVLAALKLGGTLYDEDLARLKLAGTIAKAKNRNALRADVRDALGFEGPGS